LALAKDLDSNLAGILSFNSWGKQVQSNLQKSKQPGGKVSFPVRGRQKILTPEKSQEHDHHKQVKQLHNRKKLNTYSNLSNKQRLILTSFFRASHS